MADVKMFELFQKRVAAAFAKARLELTNEGLEFFGLSSTEICVIIAMEGVALTATAIVASDGAIAAEEYEGQIEKFVKARKQNLAKRMPLRR